MHEMALCESILQLIAEQARAQCFSRVRTVCLEIGSLATVEIPALRFGFDVVTRGSIAEGAMLDIDEIPGRAWCLPCGEAHEIAARGDPCPRCGSYQLQIVGGTQMRVKELEVD